MGSTTGEDGKPISRRWGRRRGLALMPGGCAWSAWAQPPHPGFSPRRATPTPLMPDFQFPENDGMEGLAAYPAAGPRRAHHLVGGEAGTSGSATSKGLTTPANI